MAVLAGALLVAAARLPAPEAHTPILQVDDATTMDELLERSAELFGEPCMFAWGDIARSPGMKPGAIAWPDGQLDGWFVCEDLSPILLDPRLNALLVVTVDEDGALWGSHPSGDERWPVEIPDEPSEERWGLLALVETPMDPDALVLPILRAVRHLPRFAQVAVF